MAQNKIFLALRLLYFSSQKRLSKRRGNLNRLSKFRVNATGTGLTIYDKSQSAYKRLELNNLLYSTMTPNTFSKRHVL